MGFSFVRTLVRHTLRYGGNALCGGVVPVGSIASAIYTEWCNSSDRATMHELRAELERIVRDARGYRAEVERLIAEDGADQSEAVRQAVRCYLDQMPGRVQKSLRRPEDPSGRTVPDGLFLRRSEDLHRLLPDRMPRFQPGDRPIAGTDLVLEELLGVGGFGEVWKARHESRPHAPPVALKFCIDETAAHSLRKETELLDRISAYGRHRGIVELRYVHLENDPPCLEYEYVDGGDLACLVADIHAAGKATPLTMTKLFCSLAQAVGFAHRIQPPVVHRDLKPTNVLTTREGKRVVLKVLDFGIGGIAATASVSAAREPLGPGPLNDFSDTYTPLYASSRQRRGAPPDPRDDVYALGVIWYQLLIGDVTREPPRGTGWKKALLAEGATPKMLVLLEHCLDDDPAERPADAQVLADLVRDAIKEASPEASQSPESASTTSTVTDQVVREDGYRNALKWCRRIAGMLALGHVSLLSFALAGRAPDEVLGFSGTCALSWTLVTALLFVAPLAGVYALMTVGGLESLFFLVVVLPMGLAHPRDLQITAMICAVFILVVGPGSLISSRYALKQRREAREMEE
jgi:serine/threonine protein kinase